MKIIQPFLITAWSLPNCYFIKNCPFNINHIFILPYSLCHQIFAKTSCDIYFILQFLVVIINILTTVICPATRLISKIKNAEESTSHPFRILDYDSPASLVLPSFLMCPYQVGHSFNYYKC